MNYLLTYLHFAYCAQMLKKAYQGQSVEQSGLGYKIAEKKGGGGEWEGMWTWSTRGSVQGSGYKTAEEKEEVGVGRRDALGPLTGSVPVSWCWAVLTVLAMIRRIKSVSKHGA